MDTRVDLKGTLLSGLRTPGGAAAVTALKSAGANALVGAMIVVGLVGLARMALRLAGELSPGEHSRPPLAPR